MINRIKKAGERLLPLLFWLLIWQILALIVNKELLLASPISVLKKLKMIGDPAFWSIVGMSVLRTGEAYIGGILIACLLAVFSYLNRMAERLIRPFLTVVRATPVASFIILALVWLSSSDVPILAGLLMVIPVVYANTRESLDAVDPELLEMAASFRFGIIKTWKNVIIPSVIPSFAAACEACVGLCFKATVAAEVIGVPKKAIGSMLYSSKVYLETDTLLAWTLIVIVLSMVIEQVVHLLMERRINRVHPT